jgi:hypothetical protein
MKPPLHIPEAYVWYLVSAAVFSVVIRVILSALRASEVPKDRLRAFPPIFHGFRSEGLVTPDYWQPFLLGVLELTAYPVLLASGKPEYIGAWLAFKTLPRLGAWEKQRNNYQRFLIGNALVLIFSYALTRWFIGRI